MQFFQISMNFKPHIEIISLIFNLSNFHVFYLDSFLWQEQIHFQSLLEHTWWCFNFKGSACLDEHSMQKKPTERWRIAEAIRKTRHGNLYKGHSRARQVVIQENTRKAFLRNGEHE